jgi:hypothetical protein
MDSIINCLDCGETVSTRSRSCPHCGAPQASSKNSPLRIVGRLVVLFIMLVVGGLAIGSLRRGESAQAATFGVIFVCFMAILVSLSRPGP